MRGMRCPLWIIWCFGEVNDLKLAGEIIGVVAIIEGFFIYYSAKRERMLIFKFISDALWLCNLLLLGGITGAILNVIAMLRETVFYFRDRRRFANSIFWPILFTFDCICNSTCRLTLFCQHHLHQSPAERKDWVIFLLPLHLLPESL